MSPIAGVIIAVSGITGLTPIALIRRTIPVMIIAVKQLNLLIKGSFYGLFN